MKAPGSMDKKALRAECDKRGIPWDKRTDNDITLRAKLARAVREEEVEDEDEVPEKTKEEWNLAERAELAEVKDKRGSKVTLGPVDCFGWLYEQGNSECKICPHAARCLPLSEKADKSQVGTSVGGVSEDTKLRVTYGKERLESIKDSDMLAFYKAVMVMTSPTVKMVLDEFCKRYESDRPSLMDQLISPMLASQELEVLE